MRLYSSGFTKCVGIPRITVDCARMLSGLDASGVRGMLKSTGPFRISFRATVLLTGIGKPKVNAEIFRPAVKMEPIKVLMSVAWLFASRNGNVTVSIAEARMALV